MILKSMPIGPGQGHTAGRALLAQLYRQQTGQDLPQILVTDRGKPYFKDSPWHFSISHTRTRVFCALSQKEIGIDAEPVDRQIHLGLADKILSPAERVYFDRAEDQRRTLLTFWVLKEAWVKRTGEGLKGYPDHTRFTPDDPRVQELDGCLVAVIEDLIIDN